MSSLIARLSSTEATAWRSRASVLAGSVRLLGAGLVEDAEVLGDGGQLRAVIQLQRQFAAAGVPGLRRVQLAALPLGAGEQVAGPHFATTDCRPAGKA